jgi:hypothetical protein
VSLTHSKKQIFFTIIVAGIVSIFNSCGKPSFVAHMSSSSGGIDPNSLIVKTTDDRNYSVQSAQQLSASLASVTGVEVTGTIVNEYNSRKSLMTENYQVT